MPALLLLLGVTAGVLSGLFGIGGGVVIVTALVSAMRYPIHTAVGTSLGALLLPVGVLGAWQYWKAGQLDVRASMLIAGGLVLGVWLGARLAAQISPGALQRAFALFLAVMAVRMWIKAG